MSRFQFTIRLASTGSLHIAEIITFFNLMKSAFGCTDWVDADGRPILITSEFVEQSLRRLKSPAELQQFGAVWVASPMGGNPPILLKMGVGGSRWTPNSFTADFIQLPTIPPLHFFRGAIEQIRPLEAFIFEQSNMNNLVSQRQRAPGGGRQKPPYALHWFHYICREYVNELGGFSHCLETPAYNVERLSEGLLFQLTKMPFDPENAEHCDIQLRAMEHLGLNTS